MFPEPLFFVGGEYRFFHAIWYYTGEDTDTAVGLVQFPPGDTSNVYPPETAVYRSNVTSSTCAHEAYRPVNSVVIKE